MPDRTGERLAIDRLASADGIVELEVLPGVGARLHRLRAFGVELLRTPADPAEHLHDPFFWGSYVMAPWCNRLATGLASVLSRTIQPVQNFPDGTAIHGQVYERPWHRTGSGDYRITGGGEPTWPWPYEVSQRLRPADSALAIEMTLRNTSDTPMPGGLGLHPWWRQPVRVAIAASTVFESMMAPSPRPVPVTGRFDRRRLAEFPDELDGTWADLSDPPVRLAWRGDGITAEMRIRAPSAFVVAASRADLGAVAVEPQTHVPQGLRRLVKGESGALDVVEPGAEIRLVVDLAFRRAARPIRDS